LGVPEVIAGIRITGNASINNKPDYSNPKNWLHYFFHFSSYDYPTAAEKQADQN